MKVQGPLLEDCVSYYNAFDESRRYFEDDFLSDNKKYKVYEREKYFIYHIEERKEFDGLKRLRMFEDLIFNRFKYKPHYFQRNFLKLVVVAMAEKIVGKEEWIQVGPTLIKQRGWKISEYIPIENHPSHSF